MEEGEKPAVFPYMSQYSFCWDSVGMDIKNHESVGMDPNRSAPLRNNWALGAPGLPRLSQMRVLGATDHEL